jgi:Domain of unknown function (DUF1929)/Glyoxal oxidase N-terminus/Kelch motif
MRTVKALALGLSIVLLWYAPSSMAANPSAAGPEEVGRWSEPIDVGVIGIHAALLPDGKFLLYEFPFDDAGSEAHIIDPVSGSNVDVSLQFRRNLFCSGSTLLPDGRVLVVGGQKYNPTGFNGIRGVTIFDPVTQTWSDANPMFKARWYPTPVALPDGRVLTLTGLGADGQTLMKRMERFDPATGQWTLLPRSANSDSDLYAHMIVLADGRVFRSGPNTDTRMFDPASLSWTFVDTMNGGWRSLGGSVLLPDGHTVMNVGGGPTSSTEVIDFSDPTPHWSFTDSMSFSRYNHNTVLLPDGTVLAVGGGQGPDLYDNPVKPAELYDPATGQWTEMAAQAAERTYHSTALLLPDGRVMSAGSDGGDMPRTIEYYSPPYLFKGNRPTIESAPSSVGYGKEFRIETPDAAGISTVALIRLGTTTHANDFDQRYVDLSFTPVQGALTAVAPGSANLAPPGHYMLFIVNSNGVPAIAKILHLS